MAITNFREPLPEDRLSEEERDKRIRIFDQFSKKLKTEMRAADFDDKSAIRQLLNYAGQRLRLLDLENRHARGLAKYDSLLGATAKPVSQGLIGVAVDAVLDFGLRDREKMIKNHEEDTEPLIAEISLLAPEIDKLLDQRPKPDKEDPVLRPSSCLPETATVNQLEPSIYENAPKLLKPELGNSDEPQIEVVSEARTAGDQNANEDDPGNAAPAGICLDKDRPNSSNRNAPKSTRKSELSDEDLRKKLLDSKMPSIKVLNKRYRRHFIADTLMNLKYLTVRQRVAVVLWFGYDMRDVAIGELMSCVPKTAYDHRQAAQSAMDNDPSIMRLLKNFKRKNRRFNEEEDASGSE